MAGRGRPRKVGQTRMGAAIDALTPMGFSKDLIMRKVKGLLKVYDGEWQFIEESSYAVLFESMLEEQEEDCKKKNDGDADTPEPSNAHDDAMPNDTEPSCTRSGAEFKGAEQTNDRDATSVLQAGVTEQWKDISCIPPARPREDGQDSCSTGVTDRGLQVAVDLHARPRRKPCYGWIGSEEEDEEDCVFFETSASLRKKMKQGVDCQNDRKSRWDVK